MNGARLAQERGAEQLEDAIDLDKRAPEFMGGGRVIGGVDMVSRKADRVRHLVRQVVDRYGNADAVEEIDHPAIEFRDWLRLERQRPFVTPARPRDEARADEVEFDLEDLVADRDRRRAKARAPRHRAGPASHD